MPSRATISPRAGPVRLTGLGLLPQGKVAWVLLPTEVLGERSLTLLLKRLVVSVVGPQSRIRVTSLLKCGNVKVDRSLGLICESLVNNSLDELGDLGNVFGDTGDDVGSENASISSMNRASMLWVRSVNMV